ncbi:MAG TPA: hypothetical protein VGC45_00170 [Gryllotalpicola sp.]
MSDNKPIPESGLGEHLWVILTNAKIDREEEFNAWYHEHLQEITNVEGHTWGQRFVVDPDQRPGQTPKWKYLALYGFEGDVNAIHERLRQADASGEVAGSDALDPDYVAWVYTPTGDRVVYNER